MFMEFHGFVHFVRKNETRADEMTNGKFPKWQELLLEPPRVCESQFAMNSLNGNIANGNMNDGKPM